MIRPSKTEYYLGIASKVLERGTCVRRNYGAVIVKNDEIIATGYTGAPRGLPNCLSSECLREKLGCKPGERYELCRSVHAEQNAIISAPRSAMIGSTIYVVGKDMITGEFLPSGEPCLICKKLIINAGIDLVIDGMEATVHYPSMWKI